MKKLDKQFFQSILIVILSLAIFLIILAAYVKIEEYKKLSYKVDVKFTTTDIIDLNNKLPISDEIGKNYSGSGMEKGIEGYSEFIISNPNDKKVNFEIYLTEINSNIKTNYIKLYLVDGNNQPLKGFDKNKVVSFNDLYSLTDKPGSRLLYKDSIISGGTKKFVLKSWVADTYIINENEEKFMFDIDVRVK